MRPVLGRLLKEWPTESAYASDDDFVFASRTLMGRKPRRGSMVVTDHLKPAATIRTASKQTTSVLLIASNIRLGSREVQGAVLDRLVPQRLQLIEKNGRHEETRNLDVNCVKLARIGSPNSDWMMRRPPCANTCIGLKPECIKGCRSSRWCVRCVSR